LSKRGDAPERFARHDQTEQNQVTIGCELCELHPPLP